MDAPPADTTTSWLRLLRWPVLILALVIVAAVTTLRACDLTGRAADRGADRVAELAERFSTGRITTTFISAIPRLVGDGPLLELGAFEATEVFTRREERRTLFDLVPLGTSIAEIRVPVTYRYHVRLDGPWRLEAQDGHVVVHAPPLRPTLPPAIDTGGLEKRVSGSWLHLDRDERLEELERSLTALLSRRAERETHVDLVRERCRRALAEVVRAWLEVEQQWGDERFRSVTVVFADEEHRTDRLPPPSIVLPRG